MKWEDELRRYAVEKHGEPWVERAQSKAIWNADVKEFVDYQ